MNNLLGKVKDRYKKRGMGGVLKLAFQRVKYYVFDIPRAKLKQNKVLREQRKIEEKIRKDSLPFYEKGDYRVRKVERWFLRGLGDLINWPRIMKNRRCRILVVVHVFYMPSVGEILEYLKNLRHYRYDLVITYIDGYYDQESLDKIKEFKSDVKFMKYKNQGYDIGPFIDVLNQTNLKDYDIVIKMQSKGTKRDVFIYNQYFRDRDWFRDLWNGVLGSFAVHRTIAKLYRNKKYGVAAAKNLIVHDPKHKQQLVKEILVKRGLKFVNNYYFVAGSCFAIKSECLGEIKRVKIEFKEFESSGVGTFSFAHAMERAVCFAATPEYQFYGNRVDFWRHMKWRKAEKSLRKMSAMRQINELGDFNVPPEYMWQYIENAFVEDVKLEEVKVSEIKRRHPESNKIIGLEECEPYLYLKGDKKAYKKYCEYHKENGLPNMTFKRYDKLINSIKKNGYDKSVPIIVDEKMVVYDGQHRACVVLHLYGKDYRLKVIKMKSVTIDPKEIKPFSGKIPVMK